MTFHALHATFVVPSCTPRHIPLFNTQFPLYLSKTGVLVFGILDLYHRGATPGPQVLVRIDYFLTIDDMPLAIHWLRTHG